MLFQQNGANISMFDPFCQCPSKFWLHFVLIDIFDNNVRQQAQANEIINHDQNKLWFAKNVVFVFGVGAIYDENDENHLLVSSNV